MQINSVKPGQHFTLDGRDPKTNELRTTPFTIIANSWFPTPSKLPEHRGIFYHGAMAVTADGDCAILDFITVEFCRPLLLLAPPVA